MTNLNDRARAEEAAFAKKEETDFRMKVGRNKGLAKWVALVKELDDPAAHELSLAYSGLVMCCPADQLEELTVARLVSDLDGILTAEEVRKHYDEVVAECGAR